MSVRNMIPFLKKAKVDQSPTLERLEAVEGENARAFARRQRRADQAAAFPVWPEPEKLTAKEQIQLREEIGRAQGVAPENVDLDALIPNSNGESRRRGRRFVERAEEKRRLKGQRAFNRKQRVVRMRQQTAEAMVRLQTEETPMGDNIQAAIDRHLKAQAAMEGSAARRSTRRAVHEARRAELGQTPDGRPAPKVDA